MRSRPLNFVLVLFLIVCSVSSLAAQGKKVALVIGNSSYATGPLRNPGNDASDFAKALRDIGFSVALGMDANKKTMYQLIEQFGSDIRGADIALFYYSGHGVQTSGENYLIPVDADISLASDVEIEGVQLQRVLGRMDAGGAGTNVVILDACRNNPFPQASKGMEKGLAVVGQKPPESVIVYATEAGETADDGAGRNGVFTAALLRNVKRSEELTTVIRDVNAEVRRATNQKQRPAKYDNLTRAVYLAGNQASAASASNAPTAQAPAISMAPQSVPSITVTRRYGSLVVNAATTGSLYLDGRAMGDIPAGEEARLDPIEVGDRSLELHYPDGQVETKTVQVGAGGTANATFTYKPEPKEADQASAQPRRGQTYRDAGGGFSYDIPDEWSLTDFPGLKYKVARGKADPVNNFSPNINIVDEAYSGSLNDYYVAYKANMMKYIKNFTIAFEGRFTTDSGLAGIKMVALSTQQNMELRQTVYLFVGNSKCYVITCSIDTNRYDTFGMEVQSARFDSLFDRSISSFSLD